MISGINMLNHLKEMVVRYSNFIITVIDAPERKRKWQK